ncbi:hypothetical protein [Mucilaginibacter polytrichastri]|uniref:hypothetical protein n=1 Tax=Mucilaginibacter polytrichastri TaxID=1302689 RepID=UPI00374394FF
MRQGRYVYRRRFFTYVQNDKIWTEIEVVYSFIQSFYHSHHNPTQSPATPSIHSPYR